MTRTLLARTSPLLAALLAGLIVVAEVHGADKNAEAKKQAEAAKKAQEQAAKKAAEEAKKQKKAAEEAAKKKAEAARAQKAVGEAEALGHAYILLTESNHDYGGHCGKAQSQVLDAIRILDHNVLAKGTPAQKAMAAQEGRSLGGAKQANRSAAAIHEAQEISDMQLMKAGGILGQVQGVLAADKRPKALEHVIAAQKEIVLALAFAREMEAKENRKFTEAEALRRAYVMLILADYDYDGHRARAAHHAREALNMLDASVMKKGSHSEKVITAAEEKAIAVAKANREHQGAIVENQLRSDAQLRDARALMVQVSQTLAANKQPRPLEQVEKGVFELNIALKIK
jgi:hypothetical protein